MYDTRYPPTLELRRTVSHPLEPARVIGFEGRDTTYGRNAAVLRSDDVPTKKIQEGDYFKNVVAVPETITELMDGGHYLYVLQAANVRAIDRVAINNADTYTFDTRYGELESKALKFEEFTAYPRERVEVSLP